MSDPSRNAMLFSLMKLSSPAAVKRIHRQSRGAFASPREKHNPSRGEQIPELQAILRSIRIGTQRDLIRSFFAREALCLRVIYFSISRGPTLM